MTQPEIGVAEVSVPLDVMKRLPDHRLFLQEALIRHQQVQVPLREETAALPPPPLCLVMVLQCVPPHLVFDHGAEVVVPEEHGDLALSGRGIELTQAMIRQLSRCGLQKLLRHQTCPAQTCRIIMFRPSCTCWVLCTNMLPSLTRLLSAECL